MEKTLDYRMIALDMDGTAVNNAKEMTEPTKEAIHRALAAGKEVIFCTGRSLAEMRPVLKDFPDMHYMLAESGAFLYDLCTGEVLYTAGVPEETLRILCTAARARDVLPMAFSKGEMIMNRSQIHRLPDYRMEMYQYTMPAVATPVEDVCEFVLSGVNVEKMNLYHRTPEDRELSLREIMQCSPRAEIVQTEITCLECSPPGVAKGKGLVMLAERLGISVSQVIMVGDSDNDLDALRAAGLAVAMGNANERVKAVCAAEVADNEHDGCAEAIDTWLLGKR